MFYWIVILLGKNTTAELFSFTFYNDPRGFTWESLSSSIAKFAWFVYDILFIYTDLQVFYKTNKDNRHLKIKWHC